MRSKFLRFRYDAIGDKKFPRKYSAANPWLYNQVKSDNDDSDEDIPGAVAPTDDAPSNRPWPNINTRRGLGYVNGEDPPNSGMCLISNLFLLVMIVIPDGAYGHSSRDDILKYHLLHHAIHNARIPPKVYQ
jgi:hypothetical protein